MDHKRRFLPKYGKTLNIFRKEMHVIEQCVRETLKKKYKKVNINSIFGGAKKSFVSEKLKPKLTAQLQELN